MHQVGGFFLEGRDGGMEVWSTRNTRCLGVEPDAGNKGQWARQEAEAGSHTVESGRCPSGVPVLPKVGSGCSLL